MGWLSREFEEGLELEGGAVVTPDLADVQALDELRHLGIDADTDARYRNQRNWEFDVVRRGYRCQLGSIPATIGLAQLEMVDESSPTGRSTAASTTRRSAAWRSAATSSSSTLTGRTSRPTSTC